MVRGERAEGSGIGKPRSRVGEEGPAWDNGVWFCCPILLIPGNGVQRLLQWHLDSIYVRV